jgi:hypothetical protein
MLYSIKRYEEMAMDDELVEDKKDRVVFAVKTHWESGGIAPLILNIGAR